MRVFLPPLLCAMMLAAGLLALTPRDTSADPQTEDWSVTKLVAVKPKQFAEALKGHHGKVVVVDVWADYCIPCRKEFPNLVRLHGKYAKEGLVCVSCSVDDAEGHDNALKFLKKVKATFPNYRIDFKENKEWQNHFDLNGPPLILVYGRDGKLAKRFFIDADNQFTYEDVEKLVVKLLPARK